MDRYDFDIKKGATTIIDRKPRRKFKTDVCTVYTQTAAMSPCELASILNKWDKLQNLPYSATKKEILTIINQ